jgi:molybdenum cofactor cytidylyltransferase
MDIRTALGLKPGEMVALVGAGGKTSTAWQLLRLLVRAGERAVFTTTTRIFEPQQAPLILNPHPDPADIIAALLASPALFLAAERGEMGAVSMAARSPYPARPIKLVGLDPQTITELGRRLPGVTWIVEADGAKGCMLKAPADYEPAIPAGSQRVVVTASLEALGRPLDAPFVHRAEIAARLLGLEPGTPITPAMLAALLVHPHGGLKGVPPGATVIALLTQTGSTPHPQAEESARQIARSRRFSRVVLANPHAVQPVLGVLG